MIKIEDKFKECFDILLKEIFLDELTPRACLLHSEFNNPESISHNCLGCNFAEFTNLIENHLKRHKELVNINQDITIYILLIYLLVERVEIILNIIQLPDVYKEKHFKVFNQIRKWANFIKHPKSFVLTHHPEYDFLNSGKHNYLDFDVIINEQFVNEYYKGESDREKQKKTNINLRNKLKGKSKIIVVYPDVSKLTTKFCYSFNKFIELILNNDIYKELLKDETTINNYFENE